MSPAQIRIETVNTEEFPLGSRVWIDDTEVVGMTEISFRHIAGEPATVVLSFIGHVTVNGRALVADVTAHGDRIRRKERVA